MTPRDRIRSVAVALAVALSPTLFQTQEAAAQPAGTWQMPTPGARPAPQVPAPTAPAYRPAAPQTYRPYTTPYPTYRPYVPPAPVAPAPEVPVPPIDDGETQPPYVDLMLATQAPLSLGAEASLELPGRVLAQLHVGWMPPAYGSLINEAVAGFGGYDASLSGLVNGALDDATTVRASLGWRPFPKAGFEITGGYTSIALSGSVSPADVASVVGGEVAAYVARQVISQDVTISSQLHNVHVGVGWRWVAWRHLVIRASLGYTQTLASSSSVEIPDQPSLEALANPVVDGVLDPIYTDYVKLPTLGLAAGYRF